MSNPQAGTLMGFLNLPRMIQLDGKAINVLNQITKNSTLLGHFFNTFSSMEHFGSKVMTMSYGTARLNSEQLQQIMEENVHAILFKKMAEKCLGYDIDYNPKYMLGRTPAKFYQLRIGAVIRKELRPEIQTPELYSLTCDYSAALEEVRSLWWFTHIDQALQRNEQPYSLKRIINDESRHVDDLEKSLFQRDKKFYQRIENFHKIECVLFERFVECLTLETKAAIKQHKAA